MKLLLLCVLVVLTTAGIEAHLKLPAEMHEMLEALQKTCEDETGVSTEFVDAAKKLDFKPDPTFKCFLKCMMVNMQCLTEDGVFDRDTVIENIPEELKAAGALTVLEKCKDTKGSDPCDTAYELVLCFSKNSEEISEVFV